VLAGQRAALVPSHKQPAGAMQLVGAPLKGNTSGNNNKRRSNFSWLGWQRAGVLDTGLARMLYGMGQA